MAERTLPVAAHIETDATPERFQLTLLDPAGQPIALATLAPDQALRLARVLGGWALALGARAEDLNAPQPRPMLHA